MAGDFRVRFAPSPTGRLHIGNARTAILNWLLACRHGGSFILRIEDTDLERSSAESERSILEDLRWLGLEWQEGPEIGGPHAPYRQSERLEHYRRIALELVGRGAAYHSRANDEQLEEFRRVRLERGESTAYRGELEAGLPEDSPASIRFRVPEGRSSWPDLVKGEVTIGHEQIGDFVLLRSDGRPTYNFAVVADDLEMRISHVIRGDDHLSNTPRQLMLYRALEQPIPEFAHIPMILGPDGQRLSKRHGATSVGEFREAGFLPQALINYLSLLSWSSPSGEDFLPPERLCREIDFARLGRSAAVFDEQKLRWLNGKYLRQLPGPELAALLRAWAGPEADPFTERQFAGIAEACRESLELAADIRGRLEPFRGRPSPCADPEDRALLAVPEAARVLAATARALRALAAEAEPDALRTLLGEVGRSQSVKGKLLFMPLRLALTGSRHGPELPRVMAVLGPVRCAELLEQALETENTVNRGRAQDAP